MRDILDTLERWNSAGDDIALATVVSTWGSSPRKAGSKMAVRPDGTMVGSVSGGCVEGAVTETALQVIQGDPPRLLKFGVSDETAWEVGLACGGSIEVFVHKLDREILKQAARLIHQESTVALLTCIEGAGDRSGSQLLLNSEGDPVAGDRDLLAGRVIDAVREALTSGSSVRLNQEPGSDCQLFLDVIPAPSKLVMIGGVHISIALAEMARVLGYKTIIVDPRRSFASDERFPGVDLLIQSWPQDAYAQIALDNETAVAVLTHDPKIDDPAILGALDQPVFYLGVLGSRRTHAKRMERLKQAGCSEEQLVRLHAPIGLDIGARSPEEIALSIMAEITSARHGRIDP